MALIRFALILLIIFLIIRFFSRFILRAYVKNMQQNFENQKNQYNQKQEGDVTINHRKGKDKKFTKDDGDYVDYEEIKD